MSIMYSIVPNNLTEDPEDHTARVKTVKSITQKQLIDKMNIPGQVTKTETIAVLNSFKTIIKEKLAEGYTVLTDMNRYSVSISGSFDHDEDIFDPDRHKINLNTVSSIEMKEAVERLEVHRVDAAPPTPFIKKVINTRKKVTDESLTINSVGEIKGRRLKFKEEDQSQGVFLVEDNGTSHRCTNYLVNKPSNIMFYVPKDVPEGNITVVVRAGINNDIMIRSFTYDCNISAISED